jgi:hypothetical protein
VRSIDRNATVDAPEDAPDRAKILGGTLAKIAGFDDSKKLAPVNPPAPEPVPAPL